MTGQSSEKGPSQAAPFIVFTDLDATLLDHDTYSWQAAAPAIEALRKSGCPLILCSSKTLAEMVDLAHELATQAPLVAENGAFIAIPHSHALSGHVSTSETFGNYAIELAGPSRNTITGVAHGLRTEHSYRFEGFSDWSAKDIASHTGLSLDAAQRAGQRLATEPILWHDDEERWGQFETKLAEHDIRAVRGGRFIHLMGNTDKARGVESLIRLYQTQYPEISWTSVALGDSPNDLGMLSRADIAVVIPNPHRSERLEPDSQRIIRAPHPGPQGWNKVICELLQSSSLQDVGISNDG